MKQTTLAKWLKVIIIIAALFGISVFAIFIPLCGKDLTAAYPEFENRYWPWLIFLWAAAVPCFAALITGWMLADSMKKDKCFTFANAKRLKLISLLAAGDTAFFFAGNIVLLFLDLSHPGIVLETLVIVFAGIAISVAAAALSHLIRKAAELQEQSDLTV